MPYALVATPDVVTADTLAALLVARGLTPVVVRDGGAVAAVLAARGAPALAIVELSLPVLDGFGVIRAVRAIAPAATAPVVALSSVLAMRTRAMELRASLGIGGVLSMQLSVDRIDRLVGDVLALSEPAPPPAPSPTVAAEREAARLAEIVALGLEHGGPPRPDLQLQLGTIARQFGVGIVLASVITQDRQHYTAYHGLSEQLIADRGVPRASSFCHHLVDSDRHDPLIVPNTTESPLFAAHPAVRSGMVGSYVGVPLVSPRGHVLGTLCVIDAGAWLGSADLVDALRVEARGVVDVLCGPQRRERASTAVPLTRPPTTPPEPAPPPRRGLLKRLTGRH